MTKTAIVYASTHHGNTRKLAEAIAARYDVTLIDCTLCLQADLSGFDLIGFASGIDFGKFYECIHQFLRNNLPENKQVFFLYTCAKTSDRFTGSIRAEASEKGSLCLGEYGCRGYNTYGPWKLIGGMNKNHPTIDELNLAVSFYESILNMTKPACE